MLPLLEVLLAFYPLNRSGLATPVPGSLSYLIAESSVPCSTWNRVAHLVFEALWDGNYLQLCSVLQ
jgi:hypothetical protein